MQITLTPKTEISIHAPREGSDSASDFERVSDILFQSTLPVRGATGHGCVQNPGRRHISIHAPREGSDQALHLHGVNVGPISIHAPRDGSD